MAEPEYRAWANAGIGALQQWYRPGTGLWAGTGWWNSANALTAVIGYTALTGDESHADGPSGLVNDGITASGQNNGATTWTYNQGVILGGLAALFGPPHFVLHWAGPFDQATPSLALTVGCPQTRPRRQ